MAATNKRSWQQTRGKESPKNTQVHFEWGIDNVQKALHLLYLIESDGELLSVAVWQLWQELIFHFVYGLGFELF